MTEPATDAMSFGSPIADRIAAWAKDHPEADEYHINTELEARELLITIAAQIKVMMRDMVDPQLRRDCKTIRNAMCAAAAQQRALDYIGDLNDSGEQLEFLGLAITVPEKVLQ